MVYSVGDMDAWRQSIEATALAAVEVSGLMPYIPKQERERAAEAPATVGELTYAFTKVALDYLDAKEEIHFSDHAEVLGALAATQAELYRRRVAPYEDTAKVRNGDVY
ncbi:MAG TPA: hypothetical protein VI341_09655 [Actinomycetota bacterium]